MLLRITLLSVLFIVLLCERGQAQSLPPPAGLYANQVKPLIDKNCLGCHNAQVKQGGLDLSSREALLRGSEHGRVVVPGNPADSQLYKLIAHVTQPAMPFKGAKLPAEAIAKFAEWISAGVPYGDSAEEADAAFAAGASKHWAFRKPAKPPSLLHQVWA